MRAIVFVLACWIVFPAVVLAQDPPGASPIKERPKSESVDSNSTPLTDPSQNVKAVLDAGLKALADVIAEEVKRANDLRAAQKDLIQAEIRRIDEVAALNNKYEAKLADVTRDFTQKMSEAESKRIDALRASDAAATKEASTLALSSIKDITAQAFTASKDATAKQESAADKRFDQLKSELSVQFKSQDEKLALLTNQNSVTSGRDAGSAAIWAGIGIVASLLIAFGMLLFTMLHRPSSPAMENGQLLQDILRELKNGKHT